MSDAEALVREFCDAWSKKDADLITGYFTDDAVYHNIPLEPLNGREAIGAFISGLLAGAETVEFQIKHMVSSGDVVMNERVDVFKMGAKEGAFRVAGIFEVRDGKIAAWRDYFDMAPVTAFLTGQG